MNHKSDLIKRNKKNAKPKTIWKINGGSSGGGVFYFRVPWRKCQWKPQI